MGFHAPQEAARVLGEAIDYARQGQIAAVTAKTSAPAAANPGPDAGSGSAAVAPVHDAGSGSTRPVH